MTFYAFFAIISITCTITEAKKKKKKYCSLESRINGSVCMQMEELKHVPLSRRNFYGEFSAVLKKKKVPAKKLINDTQFAIQTTIEDLCKCFFCVHTSRINIKFMEIHFSSFSRKRKFSFLHILWMALEVV
jgi:hypothetical protein